MDFSRRFPSQEFFFMESLLTQFQQAFRKCFLMQWRRPVWRKHWRLNTSSQNLNISLSQKSHSRGLRSTPLFHFTAAAKHGPYNKEKQQRLRRALWGGFGESPCHSRARILSSLLHLLLQLPCLLVRLPCTPSFTLKDSVIFLRHVLHATHLHSCTHLGLISATIIYVCLFLGGRR